MSSSSGKSFTGMVLVVLALFGVGGALVEKFRHADDDQKLVEPLPVKPKQDIGSTQGNGTQADAGRKPGFVSANLADDGTGTLTGIALRGASVALELNGKTVKKADVSKNGDFSVELEQSLAPGKHVLQLKSNGSSQGASVQSDQQITLNISKDQDIIVTFLEPGQPPQILQGLEDKPAQDGPSKSSDQVPQKSASPVVPIPSPAPKEQSGDQPAKATGVQESSGVPSKADQPNILFKDTAYIAADGETGQIKLSGTAQAGAMLNFTIDGNEIGSTIVDQSGSWTLETKQPLSPGAHMLLAEQLNDKGLRIAHAQVPFDRADAAPKGAPKSAWDKFAGIFKVEQGANGKAPHSGSDQPKMADLKKPDPAKIDPTKTNPIKSDSAKVEKSKLVEALKAMPKPIAVSAPAAVTVAVAVAAKSPDTGAGKFAFESLSYDLNKAGGLLELSGRGIPGSQVLLSKGRQEIGKVVANSKGIWTFAKPGKMKTGPHIFRASHVLKSGRIASEARMQYDHKVEVAEVRIAKGANLKPTSSPKLANGSAAKMTKDQVASYAEPAASGEGTDHSAPSGARRSVGSNPQMAPVAQASMQGSAKKKTTRRRAHRGQKPRRKMVRRSNTRRSSARRSKTRRSVKRRSVARYYLSRKNKARYMAKRHRYPRSRRTPARVRVRRGTTLWGYSEHYYGRGRHYRHIQRANRRKVKNPNRIYSGQRIKVPRLRRLRKNRR